MSPYPRTTPVRISRLPWRSRLWPWVFVLGTAAGDWASMAIPSDGSYGVSPGLISSFPCVCKNGKYEIVQGLDIDAYSRGKIDASVAELAEERDAVRQLGFI